MYIKNFFTIFADTFIYNNQ